MEENKTPGLTLWMVVSYISLCVVYKTPKCLSTSIRIECKPYLLWSAVVKQITNLTQENRSLTPPHYFQNDLITSYGSCVSGDVHSRQGGELHYMQAFDRASQGGWREHDLPPRGLRLPWLQPRRDAAAVWKPAGWPHQQIFPVSQVTRSFPFC